ncbi:MAG: hypothetical protein AAGC64_06720 [Bacteroidota bacterium]
MARASLWAEGIYFRNKPVASGYFKKIRSWVYADRQLANSDAYTYPPFVEQASGDKIIKLKTINFRVTGGEKAFGSFVEAPCKFQLALTPTLIPAKSPLSIVNQINHKPIINKERKIVNPRMHK